MRVLLRVLARHPPAQVVVEHLEPGVVASLRMAPIQMSSPPSKCPRASTALHPAHERRRSRVLLQTQYQDLSESAFRTGIGTRVVMLKDAAGVGVQARQWCAERRRAALGKELLVTSRRTGSGHWLHTRARMPTSAVLSA